LLSSLVVVLVFTAYLVLKKDPEDPSGEPDNRDSGG